MLNIVFKGYTMNQVTLCGNLGRDFQLSYTQNGLPYAKNSLAISKRTTKKEENETITKDRTDWIPLTIFGRRAEIAHHYFKKGDKFLCNGEIYTSVYSDENGQPKYSWEVLVKNFEFVTSKAKETPNEQNTQPEPEIVYEGTQAPQQQIEEMAQIAENAEIPF